MCNFVHVLINNKYNTVVYIKTRQILILILIVLAGSMQRGAARTKNQNPTQKQNQPKLVNKRTDILSSLNNIKLPLNVSTEVNSQYEWIQNYNSYNHSYYHQQTKLTSDCDKLGQYHSFKENQVSLGTGNGTVAINNKNNKDKEKDKDTVNLNVNINTNQVCSPYQVSSYRDNNYKFTRMGISSNYGIDYRNSKNSNFNGNYGYNLNNYQSSTNLTYNYTSATSTNQKDKKKVKKTSQQSISQEYVHKYSEQIQLSITRETLIKRSKFLSGHKIDAPLRARMLDWMIEVINSYNFHNKTYFTAVQIMDRFFLNSTEMLVPVQLHIIGVCSILAATKIEQIYPLKLKTTYEKIVHKKISIDQLLQMEAKILETLNYNMITTSLYDLVMMKISKYLTQNQLYTQKIVKQLDQICCCLTRCIYFNYELISGMFGRDVIINAIFGYVLSLGMGIGKLFENQNRVEVFLNLQEMDCRDKIIQCVRSFKQKFKGLNNLSKFTSRKVMELVDPYLI